MGRWVTIKGRRVYIPDEGEENPYVKKTPEERANIKKNLEAGAKIVGTSEGTARQLAEIEKADAWQKDADTKDKQIASNKAQADERNGKIKPYYVDQETQILDKKMSSRGKMIYAKSEEEALSQYKKEYPKGNPRIKESKYPEHIKRARELNKKQSRMDKGDWEERVDSLYAKYSKKFSVDPNSWLQYGEEGKAAYRQYKEAVNKVEPNKRKRTKYFRDRREF